MTNHRLQSHMIINMEEELLLFIHLSREQDRDIKGKCQRKIDVKVKVKVRVSSLDPKLVLTTSQFYLAGQCK